MLTLGTPLAPELLDPRRCWILTHGVDGYARNQGTSLATQAAPGRRFQVMAPPSQGRVPVRLLEDGYPCWLALDAVVGQARACDGWQPRLLKTNTIAARIPAVLDWVATAAQRRNSYRWGGTIGPDFDCSGLVQTAFANQGIWLPRDAYQQERFCTPVAVHPGDDRLLRPGDLLFFGTPQRCTHVAIHQGAGRYWHSSGQDHGRDGIGSDTIHPHDSHPVACHYRGTMRGAGRVERCHDGSTLA
ncbi:MAG: C40 family peptidase [Synechococcus sp.]